MANITRLTDQLYTGGDLPASTELLIEHIIDWAAAGITHVIDNRMEWSDEHLVAQHAPHITYLHIGIDDAGQPIADEWFESGVGFAIDALATPGSVVLAHCHAGVNRGPSMALAIMLALGWDVVAALDHIRAARPIALVRYAEDTLTWWHGRRVVPDALRAWEMQRLAVWRDEKWIDLGTAGMRS
jgi:dual specificity phosphatase 3